MKKAHYSIFFLALLISNQVFSASKDTMENYAYGAELSLSNNNQIFSRVELNQNIYTQTVSPSLDDIRIFNSKEQMVPFSLVKVYDKQKDNQKFDMVIYPIDKKSESIDKYSGETNYAVSIQGENVNISVANQNHKKEQYVAAYYLQDTNDNKSPISNLQLSFEPQKESWQATADVFCSLNFNHWEKVAGNAPIMELVNENNQTLMLNDIHFQHVSAYESPNCLIRLYSKTPIPNLNKVEAKSQPHSFKNSIYPIETLLESSSSDTLIYSLPSAQPINEITIDLHNDRIVLPISIYYKADINDKEWIKLEDRIIRKTEDDQEPTHISLGNRLINQIKFETINSSFDKVPQVIAYRNKVSLVFNSANNPPFTLVWGSANAKAVALSESELLSDDYPFATLPEAHIGKVFELKGTKALKIEKEGISNSRKWIVWLGLIVAAGMLLSLAIKLAKEIKKQ